MKDGELPSLVPQRNPITYAAHRRQAFWGIYLPLFLFILVIVVLAVLILLADAASKSVWADISIIYMSVFLMLSALVILSLIIVMVYVLYQGLMVIPYKTLQAQAFFFKVERKARKVLDQSVEPFLRLSSLKASAKVLFGRFR